MKKIWLSAIGCSEDLVKSTIALLQPYGLEVKGHFWENDLKKMAWSNARAELLKSEVALWLILCSPKDLSEPSIQYGLSLLSIMIQAHKGISFPMAILYTQGEARSPENLPTPLKGTDFLSQADPSLGAKLVAKIHSTAKPVESDYFLDVYANTQIGLWIEVGPKKGTWKGAMLGVFGAEITAHAVGPKGRLPEKAVLNYPLKGMKVALGEKEYTVWAVQNEIDSETSYFAKIEGHPESIIFGPYSQEEQAEVYVTQLK